MALIKLRTFGEGDREPEDRPHLIDASDEVWVWDADEARWYCPVAGNTVCTWQGLIRMAPKPLREMGVREAAIFDEETFS